MHPKLVEVGGWRTIWGSVRWRVLGTGVQVSGSTGVARTRGEPATCARILREHGKAIRSASLLTGTPRVLILACAATETKGDARAVREEPNWRSDEETPDQVSAGIMQTLISTGRMMARKYPHLNVDPESVTRASLVEKPELSILLGAAYLAHQSDLTGFDPVLALAAYNAGGLYRNDSPTNRWRTRQFPIGRSEHVDRGIRWYGDACAVLARKGAA